MSRQNFIHKLWRRKVVRFACVGVVNTMTDLTLLNIFVFVVGLKLLVANLCSASISIVMSYFLNHTIVFQRKHQISPRLFIKFVMVTGLSILAVQSGIIYAFEHIFTVPDIRNLLGNGFSVSETRFLQVNAAKLTAVLVSMVWNFALYNWVVFRHPKDEDDPEEEAILPY